MRLGKLIDYVLVQLLPVVHHHAQHETERLERETIHHCSYGDRVRRRGNYSTVMVISLLTEEELRCPTLLISPNNK